MLPSYAPSTGGMVAFALCFWGWALFELWVNLRVGQAGTTSYDRRSRYLIIGGMIVGFWLAVAATRLHRFDIVWQRPLVFWLGLLLMGGGLLLRWTAIRQLGRFFVPEVAVQPGQRLLDTGLYGYVRHPSYTGILIVTLGYGLALTNWLALLIILTVCAALFGYRIGIEEEALLATFGDEYRAYMRRTKRLIPFIF